MAQKGRHSFVIPKSETPTRSPKSPGVEASEIQSRLRTMGNYSRSSARVGEWPSKPEHSNANRS